MGLSPYFARRFNYCILVNNSFFGSFFIRLEENLTQKNVN